jgi:hypothetical protein
MGRACHLTIVAIPVQEGASCNFEQGAMSFEFSYLFCFIYLSVGFYWWPCRNAADGGSINEASNDGGVFLVFIRFSKQSQDAIPL